MREVLLPGIISLVVSVIGTLVTNKVVDINDGFLSRKRRKNDRLHEIKSGEMQIYFLKTRLGNIDCYVFSSQIKDKIEDEIKDKTREDTAVAVRVATENEMGINSFTVMEINNNSQNKIGMRALICRGGIKVDFGQMYFIEKQSCFRVAIDEKLSIEKVVVSDGNYHQEYTVSEEQGEAFLSNIKEIK